jgi:antitoxin HigA-1
LDEWQLAHYFQISERQRAITRLWGSPLMAMFNPPHPGKLITKVYLEPFNASGRQVACQLDVAPSTLNWLLKCYSGVSAELAFRLSKALGRSPESWLVMQQTFDLWQARRVVKLGRVKRVQFDTHAA